jgi:predicted protein tyrosine phosphatase
VVDPRAMPPPRDGSEPVRVLFVCSRNQWRSPTAERVVRAWPGVSARSAGTARTARVRVSERSLAWATVVMVMEKRHREQLVERFGPPQRPVVVLDVPDQWEADDPELVALLEARIAEALAALRETPDDRPPA